MNNYKIGIDYATGEDLSCMVIFKGNKMIFKTYNKLLIRILSLFNLMRIK